MECVAPFRRHGASHRCGKCVPCLLYRREVWKCRCLLELMHSKFSQFVTLTYSPEHYPKDGLLCMRELSGCLKRLHSRVGPFRFLAVGEYGEQSGRAHYHVLCFSQEEIPADQWSEAWARGHVHIGTCTPHSVSYTVGYALKALESRQDLKRGQRAMVRMSLRPGLGVPGLALLPDATDTALAKYIAELRDVPHLLRIGGKLMPLGRFLVRKWREKCGLARSDPERERIAALAKWQRNRDQGRSAWDMARDLEMTRHKAERINRERLQKQAVL